MQFTKMNCLGSSFVLFNLLEDSLDQVDFPGLAKRVSDVTIGIGSDGMILIGPSHRADFKMRVFNKDGIEADTCLNGLRCVAAYLYDTMYADTPAFTIETSAGGIGVKVDIGKKRKAKSVLVWDKRKRAWTKGEVSYVCYGELEKLKT
ncbi:diaminopimelate epimerase [Bacillus tuaregi]|uniref:hypothetical protein n=1 Tax=Bacillus tuaregi TaxID=1816695 RepID=UPI0008F908EA|nr:hypothetical protein [Bacillus tuaregi]